MELCETDRGERKGYTYKYIGCIYGYWVKYYYVHGSVWNDNVTLLVHHTHIMFFLI